MHPNFYGIHNHLFIHLKLPQFGLFQSQMHLKVYEERTMSESSVKTNSEDESNNHLKR